MRLFPNRLKQSPSGHPQTKAPSAPLRSANSNHEGRTNPEQGILISVTLGRSRIVPSSRTRPSLLTAQSQRNPTTRGRRGVPVEPDPRDGVRSRQPPPPAPG